MTPDQALASLPHGTEFRFIDSVDELTPGKSATASYTLKGNEEFLKGHFPGQPILPGVLMIEAIAQLGGIVAQSDTSETSLSDVRLTAVRGAKILGTISPGETLTLRTTLEARMGPLLQIKGTAYSDESKIAQATVTLSGTM